MSLDETLGGERSDVRDEQSNVLVVHELEELSGVGVELFGGEDEVVEAEREKRRKREAERSARRVRDWYKLKLNRMLLLEEWV